MLPVKVSRAGIGTRSVLQIVASYFSNCILLDNGEVWCWGMGSGGQMGNAQPGVAINSLPVKTALPSTFKARQIAAGYQSFCALGDDGAQIGQVYCWGRDNAGQLGNGVTNDGGANNTPQLIAGPGVTAASGSGGAIGTTSVTSLSYGGAFSANFCAISAGKAYCWGDNSVGQIGDNSILGRNVPTAVVATGVLNGKTIVKIAVDGITTTSAANPNEPDIRAHSCALAYTTTLTDARVYCWGSNIDEAIGNSTTGAQSTTPKLAGMNTGSALVSLGSSAVITDIAVNGKGTCVLAYPSASTLADTRAYCWGHTLTRGDNNVALTTTPLAKQATQGPGTVFSTSRISGLSGGAYRTCSIANLRVYCWGANNMGQIGFGSDTPDPVRYPMEATYQRMPPERTLY
jgi:alpha-tubulin suppressor-like RCC1 family protein